MLHSSRWKCLSSIKPNIVVEGLSAVGAYPESYTIPALTKLWFGVTNRLWSQIYCRSCLPGNTASAWLVVVEVWREKMGSSQRMCNSACLLTFLSEQEANVLHDGSDHQAFCSRVD